MRAVGHQALHGEDEVVEPTLQVVDDVLHAAGGVDDERDVEADLAQAADVLAEGAVERDAEAASPMPPPPPPPTRGRRRRRPRTRSARRGRCRRRSASRAGRTARRGWCVDGLRLRRLRHDDRVRRARDDQVLHLLVALRVLRPDRAAGGPRARRSGAASARPDPRRRPSRCRSRARRRGRSRRRCRPRRRRSAAADGVDERRDAHDRPSDAARTRAGGRIEDDGR